MFACVIPAYKPTEDLLPLVRALTEITEIHVVPVIIDDGNGNEFSPVFNAVSQIDGAVLLRHEINRGKGRALKTAMEHIRDNMPEVEGVVTADADGQHKIGYITEACNRLKMHPNALVLGGRRFDGDVPFRSRFGNGLTRLVFSIAGGVKVYDTQTGLRAFSRDRLGLYISIPGDRYEYEMNMLLETAQQGIPIDEFTIETVYLNDNESSHFNPIKDSIKIYACIAKYAMSSILSFVLDYALFLVLCALTKNAFSPAIALLISEIGARAVSCIFNFAVNSRLVFKSNENTRAAFLKYMIMVVVTLAADYGLMYVATQILPIPKSVAKIVVGIILYIMNMIVQGKFVFRKTQPLENGGNI